MVALALAIDGNTEDRVLPALIERGHTVAVRIGDHADPIAVLTDAAATALLVSAEPDRLTHALLSWCDDHGIRVVAFAATEAAVRNGQALHLREVLPDDASIDDIESLLRGGLPEPDPVRSGPGRIISVWGPAGAPGRTTLAITLATELAASGRVVALLDADTYAASIAPALGMLDESPGFAAACRLAGQDGLSTAELERVSQPYPVRGGALHVLTGISRSYRWPELSGERVRRTLDACRVWADYVVVDTGFSLENDEEISSDLFAPRRNAATLACLDAADEIFAVGAADPISLARYLRAHADLLERAGGVPVTTVINKVRPGAIGLNPSGQVKATLQRFGGIGEPVLLPYDEKGTDAALLAGKSIRDVSPKSPLLIAVHRLARDHILPPPERPASRRSRRRATALARATAV
ncbi:MinD-like ATPase involved in chromosome partitioning or flagellar assembly [Okibacterium sp. HSC-33S16]|uniref:AAA family ATPase n=1 Tax=Okibacterium sp. HSC-33S16 TaxID=2910965 RepID=UPI0020A160FF|nr:regulator [Okibacterium sp. HSC-33S16]MCP2031727.1 MinD-like ATPase involved in chromosome partitioning or flagellar assembly [Okibacterium sp. HSC-33S16]